MAAKKCIKCKQSFEGAAFGSHVSYCRECYNAWRRQWRRLNPDKTSEQRRRAIAKDPECFRRYDKRSYLKHRTKRIAKSRRWNVSNKAAFAARESARRAAQKAATPSWVRRVEIISVYQEAERLSRDTGITHQVDHIVPLISDRVCGLHVPWNLRVITGTENQAKGNRSWPDMP